MQRQLYFPVPLGVRLTAETRDWLDKKALKERTTASALARRFIEEQARRDLVKGEVDGGLHVGVGD